METQAESSTGGGSGTEHVIAGVRLLVLTLPEDEGEGLGFRLTRTLWDPYPWVREVSPGGVAAAAGLRPGDCLLQADGRDLLGLPVGSVAHLIRGDGAGRDVTLLAWHCGRDPTTDPELLWSCGGGLAGERSRRALEGVLRALSCCVCTATATAPRSCRRDHLYCAACWSRLERCALCREPLPAKDSPHARNLVAEQVFEAIATEYEIKIVQKRTESASAYTSPNRSPNMTPSISPNMSPNMSPSANRRGQYQLSLMRKKHVQFNDRNRNYASDPNLHRYLEKEPTYTLKVPDTAKKVTISAEKVTNLQNPMPGNIKCNTGGSFEAGNSNVCSCNCQKKMEDKNIQTQSVSVINIEDSAGSKIPHRLVSRLRGACSLHELPTGDISLDHRPNDCKAHSSLENIKSNLSCEPPVFLVPPIYVVTCGHTVAE